MPEISGQKICGVRRLALEITVRGKGTKTQIVKLAAVPPAAFP
jgi:hypothetical protein